MTDNHKRYVLPANEFTKITYKGVEFTLFLDI